MKLEEMIKIVLVDRGKGADKRSVVASAKMYYLGYAFTEQSDDEDIEIGLIKCKHRETGEDAYILCVTDHRDGLESEIGVIPIAELSEVDLFETFDPGMGSRKATLEDLGKSDKSKEEKDDELPQDVGGPDLNEEGDK